MKPVAISIFIFSVVFVLISALASYVKSMHQCIVFDGPAPLPGRSMVLTDNDIGVYIVNGSVNGIPAKFMIDTGASYTSLSYDLVKKLGITSCTDTSTVVTANGEVQSCSAPVNSLVMGKFVANDVTVQYIKNMTDISVIGEDFLTHFRVSIYKHQMIISI